MTIAVPQQWTAVTGWNDAQIQTLPTPGSWMVVVVSWRAIDGSNPQMTVADLPRNLWTLLGTSDHPSAATHIQVWACPKALYDGWSTLNVHTAAMDMSASDIGSINVNVFELPGMSDAMTIDSVTVSTASAATTFSIVMPAPGSSANCFMVAGAAIDNSAATLAVTSVGWTALTQVANGNPDIKLASAWRASTATQTPAWSSSVAANWVGIAVAIKEVGTPLVQPNPNYPLVQAYVGLGYDTSTPLQAVNFTPIIGDHLSTTHGRGIQAELGSAQSEATDLEFLDRYGAFAARPAISATLNATGTTTTAKMADAQAAGLVRGDWFQLRTSGGVLKEPTVFQISTIPTSSAGTTTVTFTPAAKVVTASTDVLTTTPVDIYTPAQVRATWAGKTYPVWSGWLETYKQTWPSPAYSLVDGTGVDALAMLSVASPPALRGEILRRNPTHYWALDDPSGSTSAQNLSGVSQAQLIVTRSKFGAGSGAADFGASTQNIGAASNVSLVGDGGTGWSQSGLISADLPTKGFALVGQDTGLPSIAGGVTIMGLQFSNDPGGAVFGGGTDPTLVILRNLDPGAGIGQGSVIKVSLNHLSGITFGQPIVTVWDQSTHATTNTVCGSNWGLLQGVWRTWALVFDRASWTMYVDGTNVVASGSANLVASFSGINIGGEADAFSNSRFYSATHADIAVFGRKLSAQEITNIWSAAKTGALSSETSERRIQRKLAVAGWKGARVMSASARTPSAEGTDTATVAEKAAEVASYEDGVFFADAAGQIQFRSQLQSYQQSSRATLGEDTASGEIPYTRDVAYELDPAFIYNLIKISNSIATSWVSATTTSVASDTVSAGKYQTRTFDRNTRLTKIDDAFALAFWLLNRYAYPQRRVSQLTIDAGVYPAAFPFVLGVEVGDLVTVVRRPTYEPSTSRLYRVLHIAHNQSGAGHWTTTLTLAIAPPPALIVGDPIKGILGNNAMAA